MSSVQTIVKGSCNCGAVQYKITGKHLMAVNCHCQDCREAHGSPYTHVIVYDYKQVEWTKGEENLNRYDRRGSNRRTFCKVCGTPMCSDLYKGKKLNIECFWEVTKSCIKAFSCPTPMKPKYK